MAALEVVARSKQLKKLNLEALGNADIFTYVLYENCQNLQHLGKVSTPQSPEPLLEFTVNILPRFVITTKMT